MERMEGWTIAADGQIIFTNWSCMVGLCIIFESARSKIRGQCSARLQANFDVPKVRL